MTDYELYRDKYNLQLDYLASFPVWTLDQMRYYLHMHYDTIQKLVNLKLLYKFNIGRLTFYSRFNRTYTNHSIIKSMMRIDAYFRIHYSDVDGFVFNNDLYDKTLLSRNVEKIGYVSGGDVKCNYYNLYCISNGDIDKQCKKLERLLIDLYALSGVEYIIVNIICYEDDKNSLEDFLGSSGELISYKMLNYIRYQVINVNYPHFKILSNNL